MQPNIVSRAVAGLWALILCVTPALAVVVELKDVASDRIERQQREAVGQIPLPGTPNLAQFSERLSEKKLTLGAELFIRVFKAESELEVWMRRGEQFVLFATYPVCHWSGTIGPKISEGDKQTPEGIYTVSSRQLHMIGRHPRSLNLGFPNAYDKQFQRTGSYILIHGGCSTVGCIAMTNPVIEEIFSLSQAALKSGQDAIQVHVFPFRMTEDRVRAYALNDWYDFWRNLKDAYDSFERRRLPPKVSVCDGRYLVEDARTVGEVAAHGPLAQCGALQVGVAPLSGAPGVAATIAEKSRAWMPVSIVHPSLQRSAHSAPLTRHSRSRSQLVQLTGLNQQNNLIGVAALTQQQPAMMPGDDAEVLQRSKRQAKTKVKASGPSEKSAVQQTVSARSPTTAGTTPRVQISCNLSLSSCRRWATLQREIAARHFVDAQAMANKPRKEARGGRSGAKGS